MKENYNPSNLDHERVTTHETNQEANYWAEFYEKNEFNKGSSFFEFINSSQNLPSTILDIGCGEGRDSFAFADTGKTVVGLDRSAVGVESATNKARQEGLEDNLAFSICDVSNTEDVDHIISDVRLINNDQPICFYMRFFLHSIPEDVQEKLMSSIANNAQAGDVFAAEFRTDKDEFQDKEFGDSHYRRYQNAVEFSERLQSEYGWSVELEIEDQGLSPYKEEDPVLYRVVATRPESL